MSYTFLGNELNPLSRRNAAVVNIILWCTGIWIVTTVISVFASGDSWLNWLKFTPELSRLVYQPWSVFTYSFLHGGFMHLLVNMLWLYFIGAIMESMTGKRHIWKLFLGGAITGALLYLLVWNLFFRTAAENGFYPFMVGASGGVTAVIIGTATMFPKYSVLLFGIVPVELMWIAIFRVILDLLGASGPVNTGGYICHIGGAVFGLIYILHIRGIINIPLADKVAGLFRKREKNAPRRNIRVEINREQVVKKPANQPNQEEIDRILDKINQSGYESLTKSERETLFRAGE